MEKYGRVIKESVKELKLRNACILDPAAPQTLTPEEAGRFGYFIFGGILGNYPPEQMSTDNAVYVVKLITNGTPLEKISFRDSIEIEVGKNESIVMPYRYAVANGEPLISEELVRYLKKRKGF